MASADVFSVAANSFSVVGLADVVFRCGKQVYEAVAKMQQVSADVEQLLTEVKDLEETVVRINMFSNDLDQAKLPQRDKRIVGNINGLLARVHQEFVLIRDKASGWQTYQAKGFFGRFSGNAKWVWSQQDITLACRRLKKLRENLDSVVSLAGSHIELNVLDSVHSVQKAMAVNQSDVKAEISSVNDRIKDTNTIIAGGVQDMKKNIDSSAERQLTHLNELRADTTRAQILIESRSTHVEMMIEHKAVESMNRLSTLRSDVASNQEELITTLSNQVVQYAQMMDDMKNTIATMIASPGQSFFTFDGPSLLGVRHPLDLLWSEISSSLPTPQFELGLHLTEPEVQWMQRQFHLLLADVCEQSARAHRGAAAGCNTCFNNDATNKDHQFRNGEPTSGTTASQDGRPKGTEAVLEHSSKQTQDINKIRRNDTGVLILRYQQWRNSEGASGMSRESTSFRLQFAFLPPPEARRGVSGIQTTFEMTQLEERVSVPPHIRTWNVVPWDAPVFRLVRLDDVKGLQNLFLTKKASPFDRNVYGDSLMYEAVEYESLEALRFLIDQGLKFQDISFDTRKILFSLQGSVGRIKLPSCLARMHMMMKLIGSGGFELSNTEQLVSLVISFLDRSSALGEEMLHGDPQPGLYSIDFLEPIVEFANSQEQLYVTSGPLPLRIRIPKRKKTC
ncbi:hypothetical protein B0J12DRAFT_645935 [Macrophomina phaseolina]|uniref:Fungal N-terminal domain-containing protein n=1 Tax=Macrophomina phaseolina TaxID=35725 RepID=A0ABQ8GU25_9PEZI|nr:hypothetical protein B0J12DRAFT_645935 [Macrophomina phaseolina]